MGNFKAKERNVVYIGEGVTVKGELQAADRVVVDGVVEGEVVCEQLIVGPAGVVSGAVAVSEADIYGRIGSDISVEHLLIVRASARIEGNWIYGEIEVERGGVLMGSADSTEARSERKFPVREKAAHAPYRRPEPIVDEPPAPVEELRVASIAARTLRERRKM